MEKPKQGYIESMVKVAEDMGEKIQRGRKISAPGEKLDLSKEEKLEEVDP